MSSDTFGILKSATVMSTSTPSEATSDTRVRHQSISSVTSEEDEEFLDDDEDQSAKSRSTKTPDNDKTRTKNKKTLGRVKIEMAYITNKIRRYTTFSKRKTGIMKKAYELATLTGTEVMLLVASETGKLMSSIESQSTINVPCRSCVYVCYSEITTDDY